MKHLNTYNFSHTFEDSFEVTMMTHSQTTDDLIQEFVDFLRACQFADGSIKSSLEHVASEIRVEESRFS